MKRDVKLFVQDILDNINDIGEFSKNLTKEKLISSKLKQNAIVRSIEIIGEAVKNIPDSIKEKYKDVEWNKIAGARDIIIHRYFKVDLESVWDVIENDLPILKKQMEKIKTELD